MGLFGPAWKTKSERKLEKAFAAVDEAERSQLSDIAIDAPLLKVRLHACERLGGDDDVQTLIRIARMADNEAVKNKAIERILDTTSAKPLDLVDKEDERMREAMIECPHVPAYVLARVSNWDRKRDLQERATYLFEKRLESMGKSELISLLCDEPPLAKVAQTKCEMAWKRLTSLASEGELLRIVQEHPRVIVTDAAWSAFASKLPAEKLLDLALDESHPYCIRAKYKIHDVLSADELRAMAGERGIIEVRLCDRLLHHRDERCRCVWCHRQLNHDFLQGKILKVGDACRYCGAKVKTIDISRNPFTDELTGSIIVEYADGTEGYMEY